MTLSHTAKVDTKRRSTLPPGVNPRSSVHYEPQADGSWRMTVLVPPAAPRTAARAGRVRTRNGIPLVSTGRRVTRAEVAAALYDED